MPSPGLESALNSKRTEMEYRADAKTIPQLDLILQAVEYGYRQCEKGHNLQYALAGADVIFTTTTRAHNSNALFHAITGEQK